MHVAVLNHYRDIFNMHDPHDTQRLIENCVHFATSSLPRRHYECGRSIILRTLYLLVWNLLSTLSAWWTSTIKRKQL